MTTTTTTINLGDIVKDTISGFQGVASSRHEFLNGCVRIGISPQKTDKDGKLIETLIFDIEQVAFVKAGKPRTVIPSGGDRPMPRSVR